jgi:hypothetical protein
MKTAEQITAAIKNATFGIELETLMPRSKAAELGLVLNSSNWSRPINLGSFGFPLWEAKYDSTITGVSGMQGIEFVSKPLKGDEGIKDMIRFTQWLNDNEVTVNSKCGCHIHLGIGSVTEGLTSDEVIQFVINMTKAANKLKGAIFAQCGSANRFFRNTWGKPLQAQHKARINNADKDRNIPDLGDRYMMINTQPSMAAGRGRTAGKVTIEFRAFCGTTNADKILTHLYTVFACATLALGSKSISWTNGRNATADKADKQLNSLFNGKWGFLSVLPTMQARQRKFKKVARAMAAKFTNKVNRMITNGSLSHATIERLSA